jgi:hypothetical protein
LGRRRAASGQDYLTTDPAVLRRGKIAFADNCAQCHSSKQPANLPSDPELRKGAWRQLVLRDDFLVDNYMSDDHRHPLSELGTNAARATGDVRIVTPSDTTVHPFRLIMAKALKI